MMILQHKFIEFAPNVLDEGVIYISMEYGSALHKCACGCGELVVTPFSPFEWQLSFDGKSVTLYPSIGNWNFECKSHYWIRNNKVVFAKIWTNQEFKKKKKNNFKKKKFFFWSKKIK